MTAQSIPVAAQTSVKIDTSSLKSTSVDIAVGHSSLLQFVDPIDRASVNNSAVADVVVVSPTQVLVHGKEAGSTSLVVWHDKDNQFFNLNVTSDLETLDQVFKNLFPNESITASNASGSLILSGQVRSGAVAREAETLAQNYSKNVINLLHVERQPIDALLRDLFPQAGIKAVETHDGIILSGEVASQELVDSVVNVAQLYEENVTNLLKVEGRTGATFKDVLAKLLPGESMDAYEMPDGTIILSGKAKHPANVIKAEQAARASGGNVVNLVDVSDQKQVLIEVRFLEVSRTLSESFGFNYLVQTPDLTTGSFTGTPLSPQLPSTPQFSRLSSTLEDFVLTDAVNQVLEFRGGTDISTALNMLKKAGLLRILAEPNLIAMSGEKATFLAGGEFPIPIAQDNGATTIEFKEFGIGLNFEPVVSSDDMITMQVDPEVSVLDFGPAAVTLSGFSVPGLITRRASTKVQMMPGESLVIGGLLSQNDTMDDSKVPMLSEIPVLGKLFTSESFRKEETELVVIVTPRLKQPQVLDTPERLADNELINEAIDSHMSEPPFSHSKAEAIRSAILSVKPAVPVREEETVPEDKKKSGVDGLDKDTSSEIRDEAAPIAASAVIEEPKDAEVVAPEASPAPQPIADAEPEAGVPIRASENTALEDTRAEETSGAETAPLPSGVAKFVAPEQNSPATGAWEQDAPDSECATEPGKKDIGIKRGNYISGAKAWDGRL